MSIKKKLQLFGRSLPLPVGIFAAFLKVTNKYAVRKQLQRGNIIAIQGGNLVKTYKLLN